MILSSSQLYRTKLSVFLFEVKAASKLTQYPDLNCFQNWLYWVNVQAFGTDGLLKRSVRTCLAKALLLKAKIGAEISRYSRGETGLTQDHQQVPCASMGWGTPIDHGCEFNKEKHTLQPNTGWGKFVQVEAKDPQRKNTYNGACKQQKMSWQDWRDTTKSEKIWLLALAGEANKKLRRTTGKSHGEKQRGRERKQGEGTTSIEWKEKQKKRIEVFYDVNILLTGRTNRSSPRFWKMLTLLSDMTESVFF